MGILPALPAEGWLRSDALPISGLLTPQSKGPLLAPIPIPFCLWRGSEAATCQLAVGLSAAGASCLRLGQRCTLLFFLSFFSGCSRDFLGEENGASRFVRCICAVGSCRKWSRKQARLPAPHRCVTFLLMAQISCL